LNKPDSPTTTSHIEPAEKSTYSNFPDDDFRATAAAFSQVSGLLGGFCMTILVLVLPKDFLQDQPNAKNWIVGLILFAAFLYVASASFLANSMNSLVIKKVEQRVGTFSFAILLFHLANLLLGITLIILVYQFSSFIGLIAITFIGIIIIIVAFANFGIALGIVRRK
jgi:hypothetical protein